MESGHGASMHMAASSRARSLVAKVSLECACLGQVSTVRPRVFFWGECCVAAFSIMWHVAGIFTGHGHTTSASMDQVDRTSAIMDHTLS